jgi:hypothetical protein
MGESQHPDPGSGMNNPDHIFKSLETIFFAFFGVKILKFFDEDPGSGMETVRIRHPERKKVGSGINIPDPPHWYPDPDPAKSFGSDRLRIRIRIHNTAHYSTVTAFLLRSAFHQLTHTRDHICGSF